MTPNIGFADFMARIRSKFQRRVSNLGLKFTDEDGAKITLQDESDFELAIETARTQAKGKSKGKIRTRVHQKPRWGKATAGKIMYASFSSSPVGR